MKIISFAISTLMAIMPMSVCLDEQTGFLVDSDRPSIICLTGKGDNFKEDITIEINTLGEKVLIEPIHNSGYQPKVLGGNFLNNGLEQLLYSVDSGGSGGYNFYELYSIKNGEGVLIFNSDNFLPIVSAKYINEDIIEIDYQGQKLYMGYTGESCNENDCENFISSVNSILPYYNISLDRYYLQVLQKVYGGFTANNYGYIFSLLQINEDGYDIINIGILSNFDYVNL